MLNKSTLNLKLFKIQSKIITRIFFLLKFNNVRKCFRTTLLKDALECVSKCLKNNMASQKRFGVEFDSVILGVIKEHKLDDLRRVYNACMFNLINQIF